MPNAPSATPPLPALATPAVHAGHTLRPVVLLVLSAFVLRVLYLRFLCPYALVEDEAQYWLWAQYPGWSYYSKGPGVAWTIWLSTHLLGNAEWAVRLPAAIASAIGALSIGALARDLTVRALLTTSDADRPHRATPRTVALWAAIAFMLAPALQMVGILMTIDGPYIACWAVACWAFNRALHHSSRIAWPIIGAAIALGFLYKYTMLLLVPGLLMYAILARRDARPARSWRVHLTGAIVIAALGLLPVILWNAQHDWSTVRHLLGHLGVSGGDMPTTHASSPSEDDPSSWSPLWLPSFILQQLGMIGPGLVLAGVAAYRTLRPSTTIASPDPRRLGHLFLICAAAPILVFYAIVSLIAEPEGNWPLAAHVTLLPLGAWWAADMLTLRRARLASNSPFPKGRRALWLAALLYGLIALPVLHRADLLVSTLNTLGAQPWFRSAFTSIVKREPKPVAIGRLIGAREMAQHAERILAAMPQEPRPFIITQHYGRACQLAYYLPVSRSRAGTQTPDVLCAMASTGGRKSQFDMWPFTSLARPDLAHRPALLLSNDKDFILDFWRGRFTSVALIPTRQLEGEHKKDRVAYVGFGYVPSTPARP